MRLFCDTMDCRLPRFSVRGIFQAMILKWASTSFSRGSFWPRDPTHVSCIAGRFFTTEPLEKPIIFLLTCSYNPLTSYLCPLFLFLPLFLHNRIWGVMIKSEAKSTFPCSELETQGRFIFQWKAEMWFIKADIYTYTRTLLENLTPRKTTNSLQTQVHWTLNLQTPSRKQLIQE